MILSCCLENFYFSSLDSYVFFCILFGNTLTILSSVFSANSWASISTFSPLNISISTTASALFKHSIPLHKTTTRTTKSQEDRKQLSGLSLWPSCRKPRFNLQHCQSYNIAWVLPEGLHSVSSGQHKNSRYYCQGHYHWQCLLHCFWIVHPP